MELSLLKPIDAMDCFAFLKYVLTSGKCSKIVLVRFTLFCNELLDSSYETKQNEQFNRVRRECLTSINLFLDDPQAQQKDHIRRLAEEVINVERSDHRILAIGQVASYAAGVVIHGTPNVALACALDTINLLGEKASKVLADWLFNEITKAI